jgi:hypothetical protein
LDNFELFPALHIRRPSQKGCKKETIGCNYKVGKGDSNIQKLDKECQTTRKIVTENDKKGREREALC